MSDKEQNKQKLEDLRTEVLRSVEKYDFQYEYKKDFYDECLFEGVDLDDTKSIFMLLLKRITFLARDVHLMRGEIHNLKEGDGKGSGECFGSGTVDGE